MTRTELLAELEAAAIAYGQAWTTYAAAFDRNGDHSRREGTPMHPETSAACNALYDPKRRMEDAARSLTAFDAEAAKVAPAGNNRNESQAGALAAFALQHEVVEVRSILPGHGRAHYTIDASNGFWLAFMAADGWTFEKAGEPTEPTETTLRAEARAATEAR